MHYKLIIFDFDGTLADSGAWFAGTLNDVADRFGFRRVSEAELQRLRGCDTRAVMRHLGVPSWKLPLIARHMRARVAAQAACIPLFAGTPALLRGLADRGVPLAIVSSNSEDNVRRILGDEAAALIRFYACGASLFGKAAKFRRAIKWAGVSADEAIAIGDEARDIDACAEARIDSGAVTWGYATAALLSERRPTLLFDKMDDILARFGATARSA